MRIRLIAIGERMPGWVTTGYHDYAKRLPAECALQLVEIAAVKRLKGSDSASVLRQEGERMLAALAKGAMTIALDVGGKAWSTEQVAQHLAKWLAAGRDIDLLVGGPEGLPPPCQDRAELSWSLSPLTLPHPLVRVIVAEQLYRAWTILQRHPYHRGSPS